MRSRKKLHRIRLFSFSWYHQSLLHFLLLLLFAFNGCLGQCSFGGVETYEKTSGTTVMCDGGQDGGCTSRGLLAQPDSAVTRDCIAICKQSSTCTSFTVDYLNSRCVGYDVDTNTRSGRQKLEKDSIVNFFEKICFRGIRQSQFNRLCHSERGWAFERVIDSGLDGYDHKSIPGTDTRADCARLCLLEEDFICRSAQYSIDTKMCTLSRDDRKTQPEAFRTKRGVDYIENQCAKRLPDCSYSSPKQDVTVVAIDDMLFSRAKNDCKRFCDDARAFNCRSFAQKGDRCYLSGDDSTTLEGVPQPVDIGAVYEEKVCTKSTCDGGIFTYEKTVGHVLRSAAQEPLHVDNTAPGITEQCAEMCGEDGADCPAFSVDYAGQRCFKLDRNTQGRGDSLVPRDGSSYFEKICLRGEISQCRDRAWAFERVPDQILQGYDDEEYSNIPTRRDCEELCLRERSFSCRSAEFDRVALTCSLSRETRRTKPEAFRKARNVDYLENGCIDTIAPSCRYQRTDNAYPRYLDTVINDVKNEVDCEVKCTYYEKFICRSFAFYSSARQCFISGDDKASAAEHALQSRPGTDYYERNCNPDSFVSPDNDLDFSSNGRSDLPRAESRILAEQQRRRCSSGRLTLEKTTGYELIRARPKRLYNDRDGGIVGECARLCQQDDGCQGFNLDYNRNECSSLMDNSNDNLFNLRESSGMSYFEAICLTGRDCGTHWTFERFIDMELQGFVRDTIRDVSKTECEDACLSASTFACMSASYDHLRNECHLSDENRFTQSDSFKPKQGVDYLENQCEKDQGRARCDYSSPTQDQYLIYVDKVLDAFTESTCRQACSQERDFNCRSYSFLSESRPGTPQCLLSGDTQESAGRNAFQPESGAIFSEQLCSTSSNRRSARPQAIEDDRNTRPFDNDADDNDDDDDLFGGREPTRQTDREGDRDSSRRGSSNGNGGGDPDTGCRGGDVTYEKVVDFTYEEGNREQIEEKGDIGIILSCLDECSQRDVDCLAVTLQNERGGRQRCFVHDASAAVDKGQLRSETGVTYYEKICVKNRGRSCRKKWTFTRVPQYEFIGEANEELDNVDSVEECRNLCLDTTLYQCRSATYYSGSGICKLSEETRRSAPSDFRPAERGIDYLENECSDIPSNCEYVDQPGTYLPFTDIYISSVTDIEECRAQCSSQGRFNCRSFNFNAFRRECFLSADDSVSLLTGLQTDRDFTFSERSGCNSVRVECTPSDMLVHLALAREFSGRIYATGNPQACFELGNGNSEMTLRIPLGSQCGTVQQNRGRYVNHVVIQENPVIMQDTDKTVRVECAFTAEDQTVSFKPTSGIGESGRGDDSGGGISVTVPFQPTGTNIVTNTAPTPGVRMRVVRNGGETASMVGLGEDLTLRIEIDQDSAFGLFARRLEARTDNGELMNLIDESGCPVNELIFPALDLEENTRVLYADFKAFRFPSTPIVNFVATVQFCQELCEPMDCSGGLTSYGKRKRRSLDEQDDDTGTQHLQGRGRLPRSTESRRSGRLLPEHVDLGLRLTVGEDVVQKPFLPSSQGSGHHFPESAAYTEPSVNNAYFPSHNENGRSDDYSAGSADHSSSLDSSYICSPQSTLVSIVVIILVLNVAMVAAFIIFYRQKRLLWSKRVGVMPPPVPARPTTTTTTSTSLVGPGGGTSRLSANRQHSRNAIAASPSTLSMRQ